MPKINLDMPVVDEATESTTPVDTVTATLAAVKDSAVEGSKATYSYGFALFSSFNAVVDAVKAAFATAKALVNLGKLAFYDTTRIAANTLYYQDEKATEAAKKDADESLAAGCKEMEVACQQTIAALSDLHHATLRTVKGLQHTQNSLCFAWNAASHARDAVYDLFAPDDASADNLLTFEDADMQRLLIS